MKRIIVSLLLLALMAGCTKDCQQVCSEIGPSDSAPEITSQELQQGWYYGALDQKKPGTPDTWVHVGDGTRSAMWASASDQCDCN
ncbi:hypothetical protein JW968_03635 [Candidatus Woesearchaeota archaeon]|nr:hypothetical protein [Candidatus Woesearchaeota archaeon]